MQVVRNLHKTLNRERSYRSTTSLPKQHGFTSGRSTTTQLLMYLDKCLETIVDGGVVDSIYMDFSKAFGSVPHRRLRGTMESCGVIC